MPRLPPVQYSDRLKGLVDGPATPSPEKKSKKKAKTPRSNGPATSKSTAQRATVEDHPLAASPNEVFTATAEEVVRASIQMENARAAAQAREAQDLREYQEAAFNFDFNNSRIPPLPSTPPYPMGRATPVFPHGRLAMAYEAAMSNTATVHSVEQNVPNIASSEAQIRARHIMPASGVRSQRNPPAQGAQMQPQPQAAQANMDNHKNALSRSQLFTWLLEVPVSDDANPPPLPESRRVVVNELCRLMDDQVNNAIKSRDERMNKVWKEKMRMMEDLRSRLEMVTQTLMGQVQQSNPVESLGTAVLDLNTEITSLKMKCVSLDIRHCALKSEVDAKKDQEDIHAEKVKTLVSESFKQELATALSNPMKTLVDMAEADLRDRMSEIMGDLTSQVVQRTLDELEVEIDRIIHYEVRARVALAVRMGLSDAFGAEL